MSVSRWLARQKPKGATTLRLFVQNEPHTSWPREAAEVADFAAFAKDVQELGESIAEESGAQVAMRVAWFDKREKELPAGYSWTIGYNSGQATTDGSANASAVNAQRHLEAVMRLMVQREQTQAKQQSALIDGFKMLADTARMRAIDSDGEARMLRAELRALRERERPEGEEVEDDGPSALDSALEKLSPEAREHVGALVIGGLARIVGMVPGPAAEASRDGSSSGGGGAETHEAEHDTPRESTDA